MTSALSDDDNVDGGIKPLAAGDPSRIGPYLLLGRLGAGGWGGCSWPGPRAGVRSP